MTLRPNSDKVICGVLDDDCRLPEEESSEKERETSLSLLQIDGRPCRGGKLRATSSFVNSLVPMKEKPFQFESAHAASAIERVPGKVTT